MLLSLRFDVISLLEVFMAQDIALFIARRHLELVQNGLSRPEALRVLLDRQDEDSAPFFAQFSSEEALLLELATVLRKYAERDPFSRR